MTAVHRLAVRLVWLGRLAKGWLPQAFATLAAILSIVWGSYGEKIWTDGVWALSSAGVLLVSSLISQVVLQRPSYMELSRLREESEEASQAKSLAIEQALTVLLRKIAEHCLVAANDDRVSVYFFHEERFVLLARWSMHPDYGRPGRNEYPVGQGAIGDAWDAGSAVITLPATRKRWEQRLEAHHGFPVGSTASLTMQCQSIAALRIETDYRAVGVIVFESLDPSGASQETLDIAGSSMLYATLAELVGGAARLTPRVEQVVHEATAKKVTSKPDWKPVDSAR